ncbi:protein of unknown function [Acidithiobacillus ferrivorans]|uniref:Uncharacterized protein n=1 Tax=Acidithiobacillus ferrivorans TaxID=160808 RepID=A0A060UK05_9PROT|nr:hypothetical protein AFERRI_110004 [Acidithiobacillus ferrivorans]SMH64240.1 protein of unknown function [Acidithiobacillus ferrivorans]
MRIVAQRMPILGALQGIGFGHSA